MNTDSATLLGIFPMTNQPMLPNKVANTGSNQFEDVDKGMVDYGTLTGGSTDALSRTMGDDGGNGNFEGGGNL